MSRKPSKSLALLRPTFRQGDGVPVGVSCRTFDVGGGVSVQEFSVNLSGAPVPDRRYVADNAAISLKNGVVKLVFGQETLSGDGFRSLLIIHMAISALHNFSQSLLGLSAPSLKEIANGLAHIKESLFDVTKVNEPDQTVAFASNIAGCAIHGAESCLDFYQASAFAFADAPFSNQIGLDPVVRVDIRTSLLVLLSETMEAILAEAGAQSALS